MSSQVVRLTTGDVIQVRTGVIQGIGPQGPTGPTGPIGITGPDGAQGVPGPAGSILNYSTWVNSNSVALAATSVTNNVMTTYSVMSFANVDHDDLSAVKSVSNFQFVPGADYGGQVTIRFYKQASVNGTGTRGVRVVYANTVINEAEQAACVLTNTTLTVPFAFRCTSGTDMLQIMLAQTDTVSLVVNGGLWVSETGPGPAGPQGAQGIQGSVGAIGPQGPIGPAGALIANTTTYTTMGGDDS